MKSLILFLFFTGICVCTKAQEDKESNDSKNKRFSIPKIYEKHLDSLQKSKPLNLESYIQKDSNAVSIPNAYSKQEKVIYSMPIKKVSGKGLAPMPGTENLDKLENRLLLDSLKTKK